MNRWLTIPAITALVSFAAWCSFDGHNKQARLEGKTLVSTPITISPVEFNRSQWEPIRLQLLERFDKIANPPYENRVFSRVVRFDENEPKNTAELTLAEDQFTNASNLVVGDLSLRDFKTKYQEEKLPLLIEREDCTASIFVNNEWQHFDDWLTSRYQFVQNTNRE